MQVRWAPNLILYRFSRSVQASRRAAHPRLDTISNVRWQCGIRHRRLAPQWHLGGHRIARLRTEIEQRAIDHAELLVREKLLAVRYGAEFENDTPVVGLSKSPWHIDCERIESERKSSHKKKAR